MNIAGHIKSAVVSQKPLFWDLDSKKLLSQGKQVQFLCAQTAEPQQNVTVSLKICILETQNLKWTNGRVCVLWLCVRGVIKGLATKNNC